MQLSLRTQIIAGTTTLIIILLAGLSFVLLREIGPSPAALLPAERTLMLVTNLSLTQQQQWQQTLPDLKNAPLREEGTPVAALVQTGTGKATWILFDDHGKAQTDAVLLQPNEQPLSKDSAYRQLQSTYMPNAAWIFARFPNINLQIDGINPPTVPLSIVAGTGSVYIAWVSRLPSGFTGPVLEETIGIIARLNTANLGEFLTQATSILSNDARIPLQTLLRSWITRTVGNDLSPAYDILPKLNGPAVAVLGNTASGALGMAVRVLPSASATDLLEKVEEGALTTAAGVQHIQRIFDEKFTFETMQVGSTATVTERQSAGWTIRTINVPMLLIAQYGREFALSTHESMLQPVLQAMLGGATQHVADGMIDRNRLTTLLKQWHIPLNLPWQLVPGVGDTVLWTLNRKGSLAILSVGR